MTGILLVDKPEGLSSAGVIRALKGRLGGAKVGHLGTLDPFASGLLPLCVGEATKVARYLLLERKEYTGTVRLGIETDTLDRTGETLATADVPDLSAQRLAAVAEGFVGRQHQVPPMYSALKRDGVPLYKLARRGLEVERAAREIEIRRLELVQRDRERIDFTVECSKGTYVRVLAADLGRALGTVAHLERLRRTAVGDFRVADAQTPESLATMSVLPLVAIRHALAELRAFPLNGDALGQLRRGQQAPLRGLPRGKIGEAALVVNDAGTVSALVEVGPDGWRLTRMLGTN
ncbi:MAG TPA: tRNA pseudouridine(55) synthase TruB [Candidatus Binatia bacterium]|nr:tRNA pseudouridine(55) synthase TruB [Candidatus Binatia bacterium]